VLLDRSPVAPSFFAIQLLSTLEASQSILLMPRLMSASMMPPLIKKTPKEVPDPAASKTDLAPELWTLS